MHKKKGKTFCPAGGRITEDGIVADAVPLTVQIVNASQNAAASQKHRSIFIRTTCNVSSTPLSAQTSVRRHMASNSDSGTLVAKVLKSIS